MNFVYQRVHVLDRQPVRLADHLRLAARALREIYGIDCRFDQTEIARRIAEALRGGGAYGGDHGGAFGGAHGGAHGGAYGGAYGALTVPQRGSAVVMLVFRPAGEQAEDHFSSQNFSGPRPPLGGPLTTFSESRDDGNVDFSVVPERNLLARGYAHSSLRPAAVTFEYSIPYAHLHTNFQLAAAALFDDLAGRQEGVTGARLSRQVRSIRRRGEELVSCGDAPLFAIRGRRLFTHPLVDGAPDSVERQRVIAVVTGADHLRLELVEEPVTRGQLTDFDELFFADAAGITSLAECDGAKFTALVAPKIAALMGG